MPLQISPEIFKWLQTLSIAKETKRSHNNQMELDEEVSNKLMDGFAFAVILRSLLKNRSDDDKLRKLQALKDNSTPAIRLYNWGILSEILKQMGLIVQQSERSKITNYDYEPIPKILNFLQDIRAKDPSLRVSEQNALKVDINEISKKGPKDATNSLQFLTILISKNFKISPQQTLNLFLDSNKYLSHLLAKGVKNSFQPVYALLSDIRSQVEFIVTRLFCLDEEQNANFLLTALRTCWISKDEFTAQLCCQIFKQIYDQYRIGSVNLQILRNWIKSEGINTLLFAIKKHPSLMENIISICYDYLDEQFFNYIQLSEKSVLWITQRQKFSFYKNFVQYCPKQILQKFSIVNHFEEWNRFMIKNMKKSKDMHEQLLMTAIMEQQWMKLGVKFEQSQLGLPTLTINLLKVMQSSTNELIFVQSNRTLFSLMHSLGMVKNVYAPLIYKLLVTGFSTCSDIARIVFMADNFIYSFKGISSLPGTPIVQTLLKHLENNVESSLVILCSVLLEQGRINMEESLDLLQMLSKIALQDTRFGSQVLEVIFSTIQNLGQDTASSFMQDHCRLCLAQLYSTSKNISKTIKSLKQESSRLTDESPKSVQTFLQHTSRHIICRNLVSFISKSIFIDQNLKTNFEAPVFLTYVKIKVELKKSEQAELLRPIMASYYSEQDELEQKISLYMNEAFPPKPKVIPQEKGHSHDHLSKSVSLRSSTVQEQEKETTAVFLDPSLLKPSSFAIKDLQKLKQRRYQMKTIQIQREKQKNKKQQKTQKFKTIQHQKRLVQSMTTIKNDVEYKHIQTGQDAIPAQGEPKENKEKQAINIKLINLEKQQQQSYLQDAESVMRRYRKVWRYLFYKYSSKKGQGSSEERTHMGQAWKMLRDYQFTFFKKEDCFTIVRLINENLKRKNDIQFLNYAGFEDFILQLAILGYSKQGYAHLPPGQQLLLFIQQLKKVTKDKSGSIEIFDNPEEAYFQQTEVIRQFNRRLKDNPDYILPEGYKRIKQTSLQFEYDFHPMLQKNISSSYVEVLQVLDWLFLNKMGFHIIQALSIKSQSFFAKPVLFQQLNQKIKDYSKGYLQPKRSLSVSYNDKETLLPTPPPPIKKQFKPYINFSLGIKLGIAQTSLKNKSIAEEVAYCMEDILNAVENQSPVVKNKNKRKMANQFMRRKKIELVKIESQKKKEEINWKKRAQSVKLEVQALRQKRKQEQRKKKRQQSEKKKVKKQKQDRVHRERLQQFQRVKQMIAEKKQTLMQLKAAEQQKMKEKKIQYREGVQQYFRKKKDQIRQKQQEYKRKKAEQKEKKQQTEQSKKQFVKRLYLNNLKKEEEVLEKVDQIKQTFDETWKSDQIQEVITENRKALRGLFDLLLKYQKSKISATNYDQIGLSTLNFFCLKFKIVPALLQKMDVNKIYLFATKDEEDKKSSRKGINCQKFEEVIFLMSVKAKKLLNKLSEKRKKKQKRIQAFLNAQKSSDGNHYQAQSVQSDSQQSQSDSDQQKPTLQDQYLFNAEEVSQDTVKEVFTFLKLPNDKASMEERYREAIQSKNIKPRNIAIKQLKQTLEP